MGRPDARRSRRPGVVACRTPRHSRSSRNRASGGDVSSTAGVIPTSHPPDGNRRVCGPSGDAVIHSLHGIVPPAMQTSLVRRQRRRRLGDRRRPRGSGAARAAAVALPLLLFSILLLLGATGAMASVAGYTYLAKDLEDPKQALDRLDFTQQTAVYDRTGEVLLAKLGDD